jgi:hypothetical protein
MNSGGIPASSRRKMAQPPPDAKELADFFSSHVGMYFSSNQLQLICNLASSQVFLIP